MTVVWHVDDLMVTHTSNFEITKLGLYLEEQFDSLTVNHGNEHTFLWIDFEFSNPDKVQVSQVPYLYEILQEFSEQLGLSQTTSAADHLVKVRPEEGARPLPDEQAVSFHYTVV